MKIAFTGVDLPEGNFKYCSPEFTALVEKEEPKKEVPYLVTFIREEFDKAEAIIAGKDSLIDVIMPDLEKLEQRLSRSDSDAEKAVLRACMAGLEKGVPLCDAPLDAAGAEFIRALQPLTFMPTVTAQGAETPQELAGKVLDKAGFTFFFTSGKSEVHAWLVKKGSDIVTCAGKIHKDLARGFIKGDIVSFADYLQCHSFNEAKQKGLVRVVERDYIIQPSEIIEIRFNV